MLMRRALLTTLVAATCLTSLHAQSLADVARQTEEARAKAKQDQAASDSAKASVNAIASAMEDEAHRKSIYPGVMRELFLSIGWAR